MEEKGFPKEKIREEMLRLEQMRKQILRPGFLELGLTLGQGQPRILRTLFLQEPLKQRELARRCGLDVTTMSRTLDRMAETGGWMAAICAAPLVLGRRGLTGGKRVTCYPAMEKEIQGAVITRAPVTVDGNLITSRGVGTAIDFALELIQILEGRAKAEEIAESIVYE